MTGYLVQALAVVSMGVYASAVLAALGALSLITLTSLGAIPPPF